MKNDFGSFMEECTQRVKEAQKLESAHQQIEAYEEVKRKMTRWMKAAEADPNALHTETVCVELDMLKQDIAMLTDRQRAIAEQYGYVIDEVAAADQQDAAAQMNGSSGNRSKSAKNADDQVIDVRPFITVYQPSDLTDVGNLQLDETNIMIPLKKFVIEPILYRDSYMKHHIVPNSVFLYGPPGTGKTSIVKYAAMETNLPLLVVNGTQIENQFFGNSGKFMQALFDYVWGLDPVILYIDEADALLGRSNHGAKKSIVSVYLQNMDGIGREAYKRPFSLFLSTNEPDKFNGNVLRRLELHLYVGAPNLAQRKAFLTGMLKSVEALSPEIDYHDLAAETKDYTCDDLRKAIIKADAMRFDKGIAAPLTNRMLLDAIRKQGPSINPAAMKPYVEFARQQGVIIPDYD